MKKIDKEGVEWLVEMDVLQPNLETRTMKTAVEWFLENLRNLIKESELTDMRPNEFDAREMELLEQAKEIEKEQKIKMLNTFLCNAQMGEDVEDVEGWFENYEKQQSFFKPVLGEPIWNITNRTTKQQEQ
jgi:hypothetical protein